jgi:hypothetical protein
VTAGRIPSRVIAAVLLLGAWLLLTDPGHSMTISLLHWSWDEAAAMPRDSDMIRGLGPKLKNNSWPHYFGNEHRNGSFWNEDDFVDAERWKHPHWLDTDDFF